MNEEFLSYVWKFLLFELTDLKTTNNESIEILEAGQLNNISGPDFFKFKDQDRRNYMGRQCRNSYSFITLVES